MPNVDFAPPAYEGLGSPTSNIVSGPQLPSCAQKSYPQTQRTGSASASSHFLSWFSPSTRRAHKDVQSLIRDLILGVNSNGLNRQAQMSIARSAAVILDRCSKNSPVVDAFLQKKYINSHSPLFWAIVKGATRGRTAPTVDDLEFDMLDVLLSRIISLKSNTIAEMRVACRIASDQATFQRLSLQYLEFSPNPLLDLHLPLMSGDISTDDVSVEQSTAGGLGAFVANIQFPHFHRRLMISGKVAVEFVAGNRIWYFAWITSETDGKLMISLYQQKPGPRTSYMASVVLPDYRLSLVGMGGEPNVDPRKCKSWPMTHTQLTGLQYSESPYIAADEKLSFRLEIKFTVPKEK